MLHEDIQTDLKAALEAGDDTRLSVLRDIKSAITNELVSEGIDTDETLPDEDVQAVIARLAKQRKESIAEFQAGGRDDLVKKEQKELEILENYLPEPMSESELEKLVESVIADVGAEDMSDMGHVMGKAMEEVGPATDGNTVKNIVQEKLSQ
ncbi:MAG: glutamyl-tRNA amidotransferase [Parcubacteria group bacterium SW_6_46_9]|nr:MAG: glutamyl-tRNA amidotransferase [Parcubacteria group bacterium SW_6_46_9]